MNNYLKNIEKVKIMYKIGDIIGDLKIIDIIHSTENVPYAKYKTECLICHREKYITSRTVHSKAIYHKSCKTEINKKDKTDLKFYRIWKSTKLNMHFVDFYDKFYSFYKEAIQLNPSKFSIEYFNNEPFLIPLVNNPYTKRYAGYIYLNEPYLNNFYFIWEKIRDRTTNPNSKDYIDYGGRGINSNDFESFRDFYNSMYQSYLDVKKKWPNEKISIDRIDVNGNYDKNNCRWIPLKWQSGNRTINKWIYATKNNHIYLTRNIKNFSRIFDIRYSSILENLNGIIDSIHDWKFTYADISKYTNLPLNKINVIFDIANYPDYKIIYEEI